MQLSLQKTVSRLPKNYLILLLTESDGLKEAANLVKQLLERESSVVYVTVNKPSVVVMHYLKRAGARVERVFFVDCATASVSGESARARNTLFVSPQNLTGLSLAMNELITELPGKKAVVFDSMTTLAVYNPVPTVERFAHFIANKIRLNGADGILLASADANKELLTVIKGTCDKTIAVR